MQRASKVFEKGQEPESRSSIGASIETSCDRMPASHATGARPRICRRLDSAAAAAANVLGGVPGSDRIFVTANLLLMGTGARPCSRRRPLCAAAAAAHVRGGAPGGADGGGDNSCRRTAKGEGRQAGNSSITAACSGWVRDAPNRTWTACKEPGIVFAARLVWHLSNWNSTNAR